MATRTVEKVIKPNGFHFVGDGFRVHSFIPGDLVSGMQRMSPFLVLDYNSKYHFEPSDIPRGVGPHPHRGFETVTIAYKGKVEHHDSHGGGGVIEEGDVQWMTAASGVLHKEFHEREWSKKGGDFQMVQLWVNLPAKDKMSKPHYQAIKHDEIKQYELDGGEIGVIAGKYKNVEGAAQTFTPVNLFNVRLKNGVKANFDFPNEYNAAMLVLEGEILINGSQNASTDSFVLMHNDGERFEIEATSDALVLVMSGEPIKEAVAAHGPFVMNNREELLQAFDDFNMGKFGYLE